MSSTLTEGKDTGTTGSQDLTTQSGGTPTPPPGNSVVKADPVADTRVNPFTAIATFLGQMAASLEDANTQRGAGAPRWVRVMRVREYVDVNGDGSPIAVAVTKGMQALLDGLSMLLEVTLRARALLKQVDAVVALFEASSELVKTVASKEFIDSATGVIGTVPLDNNALKAIHSAINTVEGYVNMVPTPEDLDLIGEQLYRMLALAHVDPDTTDPKAGRQDLNVEKSGKLRLLQMSLRLSWTVHSQLGTGQSTDDGKNEVFLLGVRDVDTTGTPSGDLKVSWNPTAVPDSDKTEEVISTDQPQTKTELEQARLLLKALGYVLGDFSKNVVNFQACNGITQTGTLTVATVNRMLNLKAGEDGKAGNVLYAERYNEAKAVAA